MLPGKMKTIEMRGSGGPDVLEPGERDLPVAGAGQVLVKVVAAGVNGPDMMQRRGKYPPPEGASDLLGLEVSGEVAALGDGAARFAVGDTVCALVNGGGYAEYVAIDEGHCMPVPENVDIESAAGLPETFFTVWSNCFFEHAPAEGDLFLVHGGAGGIGATATQLGAALGLRTFVTCSADDADFCRGNGAERAIDYREEDFVEIVRAAGGANLILDIIGADYVARNLKAAAKDARLVQLAFRQGSKVEIDLLPVMVKRLTFTGSTLRPRPPAFKTAVATDLVKRVWPMFAKGTVRARTHEVLPFSRAREAHEMMESGAHRGKILLTPG